MDATDPPAELPPCGLYRTRAAIGGVEAGRLVYFHNHGDPGPGIYLPSKWSANRAEFHGQGHLLPAPGSARELEPLAAEGLYVVQEPFHCCDKRCVRFEADALVQLGYNGAAEPIVFVPRFVADGLELPEKGTRIDGANLHALRLLKVAVRRTADRSDASTLH